VGCLLWVVVQVGLLRAMVMGLGTLINLPLVASR
jgi:hypothetical protein